MLRFILALLKASHFPQTLGMTLFVSVCASLVGLAGLNLVIFAAAVLFGQFSVGWLNDYIDSELDQNAGRSEKPIVRGAIAPSALRIAILLSVVAVIPLSLIAAGWAGGLAHLAAVASAYCYNFWLARTVFSWIPYVISFALLPVFICQASSNTLWPEPLMILLFSLVGVVAHLLNAVPDIEIDRQAGLGGLAVSLGRKKSLVLTVSLIVAALLVAFYLLAGNAQVL